MFENFLKLFDNLLGYFVVLGIFMCILCIILFKKRIKKRKYVVMTYEFCKNVLYIPIIASLFLLITFTIQYCCNEKDAAGTDIKGVIVVVLGVLFYNTLLFLYFYYKRVYFNANDIEIHFPFRRVKRYKWEDIKEIKKNHFKDLKIKTFNGKYFTVDYFMINGRKMIKMAKEKGIDIIEPKEQERII